MASDDAGEPGDGVLEDDGELAAPSGAGTLLDPLDQLLQGREDHLTQKVVDLKRERDILKQQKKDITQKLKMAEKKKKRLKTKAKELSSRDILDVTENLRNQGFCLLPNSLHSCSLVRLHLEAWWLGGTLGGS